LSALGLASTLNFGAERQPKQPPPNSRPPPQEPPPSARQIKLWERIHNKDPTTDANEICSWLQIPKVNLVKDDWDGKTKDENTWNPTGKVFAMETPNSSLVMKKKTKRILYNLTLQVL
jgi:hypothetical protein